MAENSHHGSSGSWLAVTLILIGFIVGGLALPLGPVWWMFWVGVAIAGVGGVLGLLAGILNDVVLDEPRVLPEQSHYPMHPSKQAELRETDTEGAQHQQHA